MAFRSPLFVLGLAAEVSDAGFTSMLAFWLGGGGEGAAAAVAALYIPTFRRRRR